MEFLEHSRDQSQKWKINYVGTKGTLIECVRNFQALLVSIPTESCELLKQDCSECAQDYLDIVGFSHNNVLYTAKIHSLSVQGILWAGGSCRTFSESGRRGKQNVGSGILIFAHGQRKLAWKAGWPESRAKFWNYNIFLEGGPPLNQAQVTFGFKQLFDLTHTQGPRGTPHSWVGRNQKSKVIILVFDIRGLVPKKKCGF